MEKERAAERSFCSVAPVFEPAGMIDLGSVLVWSARVQQVGLAERQAVLNQQYGQILRFLLGSCP